MGRIEELAESYADHIAIPWQETISGAQRVLMIVYEKELERTLRARKMAFETATRDAKHTWLEVDLTDSFSKWMAEDEYREDYFKEPELLLTKTEMEFPAYVARRIKEALGRPEADKNSVVALVGVGSLFGFARLTDVLNLVQGEVQGRLAVFFPGHRENNNYRLLDAKDGWNYMAIPITASRTGEGQ